MDIYKNKCNNSIQFIVGVATILASKDVNEEPTLVSTRITLYFPSSFHLTIRE